jgi:hypothetical protein
MHRKGFNPRPDAWQGMHIQKLLNDRAFMGLVEVCGEREPFIKKVVDRWPLLFK